MAGETLHFLNQRGNIIKYHNGLQPAVNYILKGQYQEWMAKIRFYFLMGFEMGLWWFWLPAFVVCSASLCHSLVRYTSIELNLGERLKIFK